MAAARVTGASLGGLRGPALGLGKRRFRQLLGLRSGEALTQKRRRLLGLLVEIKRLMIVSHAGSGGKTAITR